MSRHTYPVISEPLVDHELPSEPIRDHVFPSQPIRDHVFPSQPLTATQPISVPLGDHPYR